MPFGAWWQEGTLDGVGRCIVSFDLWQLVEPLLQGNHMGIFLQVLRPDSLEIVDSLRNLEVSQSEVSQHPLLISQELVNQISLSLNLISEHLLLILLKLLTHAQLDGRSRQIIDHSQNIINSGLILNILTQQVSLASSLDDIPADSFRLCQFEVTVNQIGEVGEVQSEILFVGSEPLLGGSVGLVGELDAAVGEEKTGDLSLSSDSPVAESHVINHS